MITNTDFIPRSNSKFSPWQQNFVSKVNEYKSDWNWTTEINDEWKLLTATAGVKKDKYDKAWEIVGSKMFTHADEQRLKDARQEYESGDKKNPSDTSVRMFINRHIRYEALVTNDQKVAMGLIVPDEVKTPTSDSNANISGNQLVGTVKTMKHLIHYNTVNYAGETSKAKGPGVDEIEVFIIITAASVTIEPEIKDFQYDGEVKRGLYTREFPPSQEGMRAWYYARLRIKGKKITFGPPSDIWGSVIP